MIQELIIQCAENLIKILIESVESGSQNRKNIVVNAQS